MKVKILNNSNLCWNAQKDIPNGSVVEVLRENRRDYVIAWGNITQNISKPHCEVIEEDKEEIGITTTSLGNFFDFLKMYESKLTEKESEKENMTKLQLEHALNSEIRSLEANIESQLECVEDLDAQIKKLQNAKKDRKAIIKEHEVEIEVSLSQIDKLQNKFVFGRRSGENFLDEEGNSYFLLEDNTLIDTKGAKFSYAIIDGMVLIFNEEKR